ncbi:hypothetical protein KUTeg_011007 [Tegillarca granosa]|uniref:Fibrinogen C-terminal domain-containing protein n=1 Tax=Tegillarca granosa TaxID=220873 RepID=A0ABQ9F704_TEGGR|nr:hypothetical protein KUTeg_011007 [Tegillarca granosa]
MATLLLCPILFLGILGIGSTNAKDCKALYDQGIKKDGIYKISPSENCHVQVYCDMKNGGWTVIQRRQFGNVDFRRTWASYADGFGKLKGDHWLGLHYIHELTKNSPSKISFEFLMSSTHKMAVGIYRGFFIDGESAGFQMHVSKDAKYNSEMKKYIIGNGFYYHNGMMFSTLDRDNDAAKKDHCAKIHDNAGFWFNSCYTLAWKVSETIGRNLFMLNIDKSPEMQQKQEINKLRQYPKHIIYDKFIMKKINAETTVRVQIIITEA